MSVVPRVFVLFGASDILLIFFGHFGARTDLYQIFDCVDDFELECPLRRDSLLLYRNRSIFCKVQSSSRCFPRVPNEHLIINFRARSSYKCLVFITRTTIFPCYKYAFALSTIKKRDLTKNCALLQPRCRTTHFPTIPSSIDMIHTSKGAVFVASKPRFVLQAYLLILCTRSNTGRNYYVRPWISFTQGGGQLVFDIATFTVK